MIIKVKIIIKNTATTSKQTTTTTKWCLTNIDLMPSQTKPTRWTYVLHNLQGHLSVSQFLILDLNVDKDASSL